MTPKGPLTVIGKFRVCGFPIAGEPGAHGGYVYGPLIIRDGGQLRREGFILALIGFFPDKLINPQFRKAGQLLF